MFGNQAEFELPHLRLVLASGDDVIEMCGPLEYTITLHTGNDLLTDR